MQCGGLNLLCLVFCCLQTATDTQHISIEKSNNDIHDRMNNERDGLAISREIFRNITKKLRENFQSEVITDLNQHQMQVKVEGHRNYAPYQGYHHHEQHWGPYFEENNITKMIAHVGSEALLNCRVVMLKDKTVMWLRNTTDAAQLLTVGKEAHTGDNRLSVKFQYPNNWRISISPVKKSDEGLYMCQISTHPPRTIYTNLTVLPPVLTINGDEMHVVKDRFYKTGSSIKLTCVISEEYVKSMKAEPLIMLTTTQMTTPVTATTESTVETTTVFNKFDLLLNKSWSIATTTIASTISISPTIKTILEIQKTTPKSTPLKTTQPSHNIYGLSWTKQGKSFFGNMIWRNISSTISISSASQEDSGLYTCHLKNHSQVTTNVQVLIGENQAAVHHDTWNKGSLYWHPHNKAILFVLFLLILT
ncbi:unnamed protein product [Parnassius apollo]|uniref:(apollo) hypothetical protein n=1 Tax=Parnassius apollo TaxID=110799 RepID=A0A8S3W7F0_PARAO|nr:unnamed protein product [Parnassius apollo]